MNSTVMHSLHGAELHPQIQGQGSDPSNGTNKVGCYIFIFLSDNYNFSFLLLRCHVCVGSWLRWLCNAIKMLTGIICQISVVTTDIWQIK